MTAGKAKAGLAIADVLPAQWWLDERRPVDVGHLVKTVAVC